MTAVNFSVPSHAIGVMGAQRVLRRDGTKSLS